MFWQKPCIYLWNLHRIENTSSLSQWMSINNNSKRRKERKKWEKKAGSTELKQRKNERKRRGNEKEKRGEERINERRGKGKGGRNVSRRQAQPGLTQAKPSSKKVWMGKGEEERDEQIRMRLFYIVGSMKYSFYTVVFIYFFN